MMEASMQFSSPRRSEMSNFPSRRDVLAVLVPLLAAPAVLSSAAAEFHPSGIMRIVAAAAAGTPSDIVSRLVANELSRAEGWRVVVEDKPGALQSLAQAEVLRQPADGYTLVSVSLPGVVAPALIRGVKFRLDTDFAPVIKLATAYHVLVVHPAVPAQSLPELVALLKREPDKLTFSSGGFGTPAHLAGELFKQASSRNPRVAHGYEATREAAMAAFAKSWRGKA
jgi:tripartite-type tricarboxylate transporter receptor subunit TctC